MDYVANPVSESTRKVYTSALEKIKKLGMDIDNIDIDELKKIYTDNDFPVSKIKLLNSAVLWYSKNNNKNSELIEILQKIVKEDIKEHREKYMKNKLFASEVDKYIEWKTMLHVYEKLEELCYQNNDNVDIYEEYFIFSLYVLIPPRRIIDYLQMKISDMRIDRDDDCILWDDNNRNHNYDPDKVKTISKNMDETVNYFLINDNKSFFLFNIFKTKKY